MTNEVIHTPQGDITVRLDKFGGWDIAAIVIGSVLMGLNTLALIYAIYQRSYPPIKAKNIKLILPLYLSMLVWFLGTISTNLTIERLNTFKASCILFDSWFRIIFGIFFFIFVHTLRCYIYIRIFNQRKRVTLKTYLMPTIIFLLFVMGFGIPTTILQDQLSITFIKQLNLCTYGRVFLELSFGFVWMGLIGFCIMTYLARNINGSFNEFREMLAICILASISIVFLTAVHHARVNYIVYTWARVSTSMFEYLTCQSTLLVLLGVPIYNCIFHHDEYKKRFFDKLRQDGMAARYNLTMESSDTSTATAVHEPPVNEISKHS